MMKTYTEKVKFELWQQENTEKSFTGSDELFEHLSSLLKTGMQHQEDVVIKTGGGTYNVKHGSLHQDVLDEGQKVVPFYIKQSVLDNIGEEADGFESHLYDWFREKYGIDPQHEIDEVNKGVE